MAQSNQGENIVQAYFVCVCVCGWVWVLNVVMQSGQRSVNILEMVIDFKLFYDGVFGHFEFI